MVQFDSYSCGLLVDACLLNDVGSLHRAPKTAREREREREREIKNIAIIKIWRTMCLMGFGLHIPERLIP